MIKQRILQVYKLYYPDAGGIQTVMRDILSGLKNTFRFEVLASRIRGFGSKTEIDGIPVQRTFSLGTLLALPLAPLYLFWFWYKAWRNDIVDYHYPFPLVDLAVSLWFPKKTKLIIHWHADIISQQRALKIVAPFIRRTLNRANQIIVATPIHIEQSSFLRHYREKCEVIPYGIHLNTWSLLNDSEQQEVHDLRGKYRRFMLAVGRLVPYKGFEIAIKAMQHVDGILIIVGIGPLEQSLHALAKTGGVEDKVIFWQEASHIQLKCLLHAAYCLVFPSILPSEAFGMVQLEAMACRKAIINTALASGVPWVARDGEEALTVPVGDSIALAAAMNRLLTDEALNKKLGEQGYERVKNTFEMSVFLEKTAKVYSETAR